MVMILVADDAPGHLLDLPLVRVTHRRGGLGQGGVVLHRDQVGQGGEGGELAVVPEFDRVVVLCKHDHLGFNDQWMFDCEVQLSPLVGGRRSQGRLMRTMMKMMMVKMVMVKMMMVRTMMKTMMILTGW